MAVIMNPNCDSTSKTKVEKRSQFWLQVKLDLCIISLRPPPRWAKWSRGVRTRGLRVGLVGGPRPLLFLSPVKSDEHYHPGNCLHIALTFTRTGIIYGTDERPPLISL